MIVHGEAFDMKTANVGSVVQKEIQMRENRNLENMQLQQYMDPREAGNTWHQQLVEAWTISDIAGFETVIATNFETLKKEKHLGLAKRLL